MVSAERHLLTPQQRLALSRRALVRQLNDGADAPDNDDLEYAQHEASAAPPDDQHPRNPRGERGRREGGGTRNNVWLGVGRSVVERWWRRHPAHAVGQLARPLLEHYARKEPAKLMAAAAATGAVFARSRSRATSGSYRASGTAAGAWPSSPGRSGASRTSRTSCST